MIEIHCCRNQPSTSFSTGWTTITATITAITKAVTVTVLGVCSAFSCPMDVDRSCITTRTQMDTDPESLTRILRSPNPINFLRPVHTEQFSQKSHLFVYNNFVPRLYNFRQLILVKHFVSTIVCVYYYFFFMRIFFSSGFSISRRKWKLNSLGVESFFFKPDAINYLRMADGCKRRVWVLLKYCTDGLWTFFELASFNLVSVCCIRRRLELLISRLEIQERFTVRLK